MSTLTSVPESLPSSLRLRPPRAGNTIARVLGDILLMRSRIYLEWRLLITEGNDLAQVNREECSDRARGLVLMDMTTLMRDEPGGSMTSANENRVSER